MAKKRDYFGECFCFRDGIVSKKEEIIYKHHVCYLDPFYILIPFMLPTQCSTWINLLRPLVIISKIGRKRATLSEAFGCFKVEMLFH
jgi:hypothetical protein